MSVCSQAGAVITAWMTFALHRVTLYRRGESVNMVLAERKFGIPVGLRNMDKHGGLSSTHER